MVDIIFLYWFSMFYFFGKFRCLDWIFYQMLKEEISCATCKHTSKKGCALFKSSVDVWANCLAGGELVKVPFAWIKPMAYSYTYWQSNKLLPDELFEI